MTSAPETPAAREPGDVNSVPGAGGLASRAAEEPAWAVVFPPWSNAAGRVAAFTVRDTRRAAQERVGEVWAREGEKPAQGWRRAYRQGWRCIRVWVRPWGSA